MTEASRDGSSRRIGSLAVLGLALLAVLCIVVALARRHGSDAPEPLVIATVPDAVAAPSFDQRPIAPPLALVQDPAASPAPATAPVVHVPLPPRSVDVVVTDENGRPVADASIEAFDDVSPDPFAMLKQIEREHREPSPEELDKLRASSLGAIEDDPTWNAPIGRWRSDGDGAARITLPSTQAVLVATHEQQGSSGVVTVDAAGDAPGGGSAAGHATLKLFPRGTLTGQVLTVSGRPAAGARVVFGRASVPDEAARPRLPHPLQADAEGRFSVAVDTQFMAFVHAELEGESSQPQFAFVLRGQTAAIELRFPGAFAVTGHVIGPDGAPVSGAQVRVAGFSIRADQARSDDAGAFRLELTQACHVIVVATIADLVQAECVAATLSDAEPVADVELRMLQPASIAGRLQWSDGVPISGALLNASPTRFWAEPSSPDAAAIWASVSEDERTYLSALDSRAWSDADGRFRLTAVHPGYAMTVSCSSIEGRRTSVEVADVQPGSQDVLVVYDRAVAGQTWLRGRVVDAETQAPLPRCEITCSAWMFGHLMPVGGTHTSVDDPAGRFEIGELDPAAQYGLSIEAVNYPPKEFGPFKPSADSDLVLELGHHAALRIAVTDEAGAAQPGASVQLMSGAKRGYGSIFSEVLTRDAGPDGRLDWPDLKPGDYAIEAVVAGKRAPRQRVALPPGQSIQVALVVRRPDGMGVLEIRAHRRDGALWAGASVKAVLDVEDEDSDSGLEPVHVGETGADGRLVLERLSPGTYIVSLGGDGTIIPLKRVDVQDGQSSEIEFVGGK